MRRPKAFLIPLAMITIYLQVGCTSIPLLGGDGSLDYRQRLQQQELRAEASRLERVGSEIYSVEQRLAAGRDAERRGERHRALWHYLEAYRSDPKSADAALHLGRYYVYEEPERAASIFASVADREPSIAEAHAGLALARLVQGRTNEAQASVRRAIELNPELPSARATAGVIYSMLGQSEEALHHIERALESRPRDSKGLNNMGVANMVAGNFEDAEAAFRAAILENPEDRVAYNNLGLALGRQGRIDEATDAFRRFGSKRAILNNLGFVHYLNADYDRAAALFLRAVDTDDDGALETVIRNLQLAVRATQAAESP
jgi:Flp pilus assembly protein TadD